MKYHGEKWTESPAVRVWDLKSREAILSSNEVPHGRALDFDLTSRLLASGTDDGWVRIRELPGGQERVRIRVGSPPVMLRFRPDGAAIAIAGENGSVDIRELSGRPIQQLNDTQCGLLYRLEPRWPATGRRLCKPCRLHLGCQARSENHNTSRPSSRGRGCQFLAHGSNPAHLFMGRNQSSLGCQHG